MKFKIVSLFILLLLFSPFLLPTYSFPADNPSPRAVEKLVGKPAPDFILNDITGKTVKLSDYKGKVVLLFFWASWCPSGPEEFRSINKLYAMYKDRGLVVLAVSSDKARTAANSFLSKNPATFPVLLDERLVVSKTVYKAFMIPMTFVIDKSGIIVKKHFGEQNWTKPAIIKEIESLL
jgi:peroxiredoxin